MALNEAAVSERLSRTLRRYIETLSETRTKPAVFFNIPYCRSGGMADTPASGAGARKGVRVQLPASAPNQPKSAHTEGSLLVSLN